MQCDRARELIGAHIDGELAGTEKQAFLAHLQVCPECTTLSQDLSRIGRQIAAAGREPAPKALSLRIRSALAEEMAAEPARTLTAEVIPLPVMKRRAFGAGVARQAAAIATVCVMSSALTLAVVNWSGSTTRLEGEIVSAHIRSLLQDSQIQVASSDAHTVKPWFAGRIDFAPEFKDLAAEGFTLAGGRLDYIGDRRVGAIVYRRRLHVVNVFMWPAPNAEPKAPHLDAVKGYNVLSWNRGGVTYWAVSDLNPGELRQLQSLM